MFMRDLAEAHPGTGSGSPKYRTGPSGNLEQCPGAMSRQFNPDDLRKLIDV